MDYFDDGPTPGPSNYPHVHAEEVDSATPPSSPSERGKKPAPPHRQTPTGHTYARLLGRDTDGHHSNTKTKHTSRSKHPDHRSSSPSDHHSNSYPHSYGTSSSSSSAKSKTKVKKLNSLLLLTSERLTAESTRARSAEERLSSVLGLLTKTRTEHAQVVSQVASLNTQLELYKAQLSRAQDEILRAQAVVEEVEKGKKEAEEAAARARGRARRLEEERVVRQAMEQGRREGYREGLLRGRQMAMAEASRRAAYEAYDEDFEEEYEESMSSPSVKTERTGGSASVRGGSINVARHADPLPIPTLTTPVPLRVPSTQPQPLARPPSSAPSMNRRMSQGRERTYSQSRPVPAPSKSPESIRPLDPRSARATPDLANPPSTSQQQPIRPVIVHNTASPVSRRSTALPPDGFIPVLGQDSMIALPAPYELSQTPKTIALSVAEGEQDGGRTSRAGRDNDRDTIRANREPATRTESRATFREGRNESAREPSVESVVSGQYAVPRPVTTMSTASLSQFDLLSPPNTADRERFPSQDKLRENGAADRAAMHEYDRGREEFARRTPETPTPAPRGGGPPYPEYSRVGQTQDRTPSEKMSDEWRMANSPNVPTGPNGKGKERVDVQPNPAGPSLHTTNMTNPSRSMSPPRGPRRPRQIVMPQPLSLGAAAGMIDAHNPASNPSTNFPINQPRTMMYQNQPHQERIPFPRQSPPDEGHRPKSPLNWIKRRFTSTNRTTSNTSVPQISVEPPSQSPSGHSQDDELNPVLLTPDDANRTVPLPGGIPPHYAGAEIDPQIHRVETPHAGAHTPVTIVLPDNQLPVGFVPLSMTPANAAPTLPRATTPKTKTKIYADADVPEGMRYPEPPMPRPSTSASNKPAGGQVGYPHGSPASSASGSGNGSGAGSRKRVTSVDHASSALSPAPLNRPLSLFSDDS